MYQVLIYCNIIHSSMILMPNLRLSQAILGKPRDKISHEEGARIFELYVGIMRKPLGRQIGHK
ncbi:Uncharacterised protein [Plesiomonas shigelloides]|nr:Uncharacterised protein [Plesiomonas shigelloides]